MVLLGLMWKNNFFLLRKILKIFFLLRKIFFTEEKKNFWKIFRFFIFSNFFPRMVWLAAKKFFSQIGVINPVFLGFLRQKYHIFFIKMLKNAFLGHYDLKYVIFNKFWPKIPSFCVIMGHFDQNIFFAVEILGNISLLKKIPL